MENALYALPVMAVEGYEPDSPTGEILERTGASGVLTEIGWDLAEEFALLVGAVEEDSVVLDSFAAYPKAELQMAAAIFGEGTRGPSDLSAEHRAFLIALAMKYVPTRDRLDVLDDTRIAALIRCRALARDRLAGSSAFVGFDEERFNPAQKVAENLLPGRRRYDRRSAWKTLDAQIEQAVDAAGLRQSLVRLGLEGQVTGGGTGLSSALRRRVALVRAVIKRPLILVLDGVAAGDSDSDAETRRTIRAELPDALIVYAANSDKAAQGADQVVEIEEDGTLKLQDPAS